jgi:hypothetical protein
MFQGSSKSIQRERIAKIILTLIFLGGFALFIGWMLLFGPGEDVFKLSAMDLALLGLATYRLGRLIAYDRVMEPFRQFVTETVPDSTGAGESVDPKGEGFQQAMGQLVCCPICAGTWVAALLTYLFFIFPGPTRVFLIMTSVIAIAEILGAVTEALSWAGQYARTMSGAKMREQQAPPEQQRQVVEFPDANHNHQVDTVVESYRDYR